MYQQIYFTIIFTPPDVFQTQKQKHKYHLTRFVYTFTSCNNIGLKEIVCTKMKIVTLMSFQTCMNDILSSLGHKRRYFVKYLQMTNRKLLG